RGSLAGWLHAVARHAAQRARADAARRRRRLERLPREQTPDPTAEVGRRDLRAVLDAELSRLPYKNRTPVRVCYLAGLTGAEAARQVGCPPGTVKSRLARARTLLRTALTRRGITLFAAGLAAHLGESAAPAVPPSLLQSTARTGLLARAGTSVVLAEGVL